MTIIGHQHIINYLKRSIEKNKISHAYLFEGSEHLGKKTVALWFTKCLECQSQESKKPCGKCRSCQDIYKNQHPDLTIISVVENKNETRLPARKVSIDQIRELRRYLSLSPHSSPYKIAIIDSAERMTDEAANALLKTLEEPRGNAVLILITNIASALPETILSRCEEIKFREVKKSEIEDYLLNEGCNRKEAIVISRLSLGKPGIAIDLFKKKSSGNFNRQELNEFLNFLNKSYPERCKFIENIVKKDISLTKLLDEWINLFRDLFFAKKGVRDLIINIENYSILEKEKNRYKEEDLIRIIKQIQKIQYFFSTTNVNPKLALEVLALEF